MAGARAVCLNISALPTPAERNCVIMLDLFYDSNKGYCFCKRLALLGAAEQLRHYTLARKVHHHQLKRCTKRKSHGGQHEWQCINFIFFKSKKLYRETTELNTLPSANTVKTHFKT